MSQLAQEVKHLLNTQPEMKSTAMYSDTALDMLFSLSSLTEVEPEIMFHVETHTEHTTGTFAASSSNNSIEGVVCH